MRKLILFLLLFPLFLSAQQTINIGTNPNDGTGDNIRVAYTKINNNLRWQNGGNTVITAGDLLRGGSSNNWVRLVIGTDGQVLTVVGGLPVWQDLSGGAGTWGSITGTLNNQTDLISALDLKITNPMSSTGDLIIGGASGVPARLAAGTNGHVLTLSSGSPIWQAVSAVSSFYALPEDYGAVGNGSTNDAVAIQSCADSGKPCFLQEKNYRTTAGIILPNGGQIIGSGANSIISIATGITAITMNARGLLKNFRLDGTDAASQVGTRVSDVTVSGVDVENRIEGMLYTDFNYGLNAATVYDVNYAGAYQVTNTTFESNTIGSYLEAGAEYITFSNCQWKGNTTHYRSDAGNNSVDGGSMTNGTTALHFTNGSNSGKNIISNVLINHNTTAILASSISIPVTISNCNIYGGRLNITSSEMRILGVTFSDSAPTTWTLANSTSIVEFRGCRFIYTPTITQSGTNPIWSDNYWVNGTPSYAKEIPTTVIDLIDIVSSQALNNQASGEGPINAVARVRTKFDATGFSFIRLVCTVTIGSASANTPRLMPSYSIDGGTNWITIGTGTGTEAISLTTATNDLFTDWIALPAGAKADVLFTARAIGGDATADPTIAGLYLHYK